jgi:hypothetical protein
MQALLIRIWARLLLLIFRSEKLYVEFLIAAREYNLPWVIHNTKNIGRGGFVLPKVPLLLD